MKKQQVDRTALKFNQLAIITLVLVGFVLGAAAGKWLVLFVGLVLAVGTLMPGASLFKQIYARILKPAGVMRPAVVPGDPRAHQFAQGIGAGVLLAASLALFGEWAVVGWTLAWLVVVLAALNLLFGFCAGCLIYYQLGRYGLFSTQSKQ